MGFPGKEGIGLGLDPVKYKGTQQAQQGGPSHGH